MLEYEKQYWSSNIVNIAGIDEAGRGPLAGPVVASAIILPHDIKLPEVTDSKKITEKKRELLYVEIYKSAISVGIGIVYEHEIDEKNILQSTYIAMRKAIGDLSIIPDMIMVDGNKADIKHYKQKNIINGDQKSLSIASASIIAKVTRDRIMRQYDIVFPEYGFAKHKGYGTKQHINSILNFKATPIHRKSFNPIKKHLPSFAYYKRNYLIERLGVQLYACHIIKNNYKIIEINYNVSKFREIDIISRKDDKIIFTNILTFLINDEEKIYDIEEREIAESFKSCQHYMKENELKCVFKFNMGQVVLGVNKPKIKIIKEIHSE